MSRYLLQPSARKGRWVATDTEAGLVCQFEQGCFNNTQRWTFLEDVERPDASELAALARGLADWLAAFHYGVAMGADDSFPGKPATVGAKGVRVGAIIRPVEMTPRLAIGRQLQWWRLERGLGQTELAELAGVSNVNISKLENGRYNASVDVLAKVFGALGVDLAAVPRPGAG